MYSGLSFTNPYDSSRDIKCSHSPAGLRNTHFVKNWDAGLATQTIDFLLINRKLYLLWYVFSLPLYPSTSPFLIHSPPCHPCCLAFAVMNLNYAKVTFHCGDLSAALLELAALPDYHSHAYWQPFPPQKQKGWGKKSWEIPSTPSTNSDTDGHTGRVHSGLCLKVWKGGGGGVLLAVSS